MSKSTTPGVRREVRSARTPVLPLAFSAVECVTGIPADRQAAALRGAGGAAGAALLAAVDAAGDCCGRVAAAARWVAGVAAGGRRRLASALRSCADRIAPPALPPTHPLALPFDAPLAAVFTPPAPAATTPAGDRDGAPPAPPARLARFAGAARAARADTAGGRAAGTGDALPVRLARFTSAARAARRVDCGASADHAASAACPALADPSPAPLAPAPAEVGAPGRAVLSALAVADNGVLPLSVLRPLAGADRPAQDATFTAILRAGLASGLAADAHAPAELLSACIGDGGRLAYLSLTDAPAPGPAAAPPATEGPTGGATAPLPAPVVGGPAVWQGKGGRWFTRNGAGKVVRARRPA